MKKLRNKLYSLSTQAASVLNEYELILSEYSKNHEKYVDNHFYPQIKLKDEDKNLLDKAEWKRLEDIYNESNFSNISPEGLIQGSLPDCFLISLLIHMAKDPDEVMSLFVEPLNLSSGCVCVRFEIFELPVYIIIDTLVPCMNGKPMFARTRDKSDSYWHCLIEKAYCKFVGGYRCIKGGSSIDAAYFLKGYYPRKFDTEEVKSISNLIKEQIDDACAMFFGNIDEETNVEGSGLVSDHMYAILGVDEVLVNSQKYIIIHLKNPWCVSDWNGDWSPKSAKWGEFGKSQVNYKEEGHFWMSEDDFRLYFKKISCSCPLKRGFKRISTISHISGNNDFRTPLGYGPYCGCVPQYLVSFSEFTSCRILLEYVSNDESDRKHSAYIDFNNENRVSVASRYGLCCRTMNDTLSRVWEIPSGKGKMTLVLCREEPSPQPCLIYFRIEGKTNMTINELPKPDYDRMCHASFKGEIRPGPDDGRNEYKDNSVRCVRQWFINIPEQKLLHLIVKKNKTSKKASIFVAKTENKQKYVKCIENTVHYTYFLNEESTYEEFDVPIRKPGDYAIGLYREASQDVIRYEVDLYMDCEFNLEAHKEASDCSIKTTATVTGTLIPECDLHSPYGQYSGMLFFTQFRLTFLDTSRLYMTINHNGDSRHKVVIYEADRPFSHVGKDLDVYFEAPKRFDRMYFDPQQKTYMLLVYRSKSSDLSKYDLTLESEGEFVIEKYDPPKFESMFSCKISGMITPNQYDGCTPWKDDMREVEQWSLIVTKSEPVYAIIERKGPVGKLALFLQRYKGNKIVRSWKETEEHYGILRSQADVDIFRFDLEPDLIPYSVLVCRVDASTEPAKFRVTFYSQSNLKIDSLKTKFSTTMKRENFKFIRQSNPSCELPEDSDMDDIDVDY